MTDKPAPGFRVGTIALLDVLGFKGIWRSKKVTPQDILARMRRIEGTTVSTTAFWEKVIPKDVDGNPEVVLRIIVVSDSIFVASWMTTAHHPEELTASLFVTHAACKAILVGGVSEDVLPLAYRGVITIGEFAADPKGNFVVGPAVDDVASLEREAEGAFIWYTPDASRVYTQLGMVDPDVVRYAVPMKGGRELRTLVLDPLHAVPPLDEQILQRMFQPLPPRTPLDVHIKRQNLAAFCRHAHPELCERLKDVIEAGL